MDALKEIVQSLKGNFEERFSSPIIGSFIISWLICNWDPVFYALFSSEIIDLKISYIHAHIGVRTGIIYPLLIAITYCSAYPFASYKIHQYIEYFTKRRMIENINNNILITTKRNELFMVGASHENLKQAEMIDIESKRTEMQFKSTVNGQLLHHKLEQKKDLITTIYAMRKEKALKDDYPDEELERLEAKL